MDDEIKVSELPEAAQVNDADLVMIIQGGANKKITNQAFQSSNTTRLDTAEGKINQMQKMMSIGLAANTNMTAAGKVPFDTVRFDNTGGLLTLSENGIKIGAGVSQVLITGQCFAQRNDSNTPYIWTRIELLRNGTTTYENLSIASTGTDYGCSVHSDTPLNVQENDLITMYKIVASNMQIRRRRKHNANHKDN